MNNFEGKALVEEEKLESQDVECFVARLRKAVKLKAAAAVDD